MNSEVGHQHAQPCCPAILLPLCHYILRWWHWRAQIFFKFIIKQQHLLPCLPSVLQQPEIWAAHVLWITTQIDPGIAPFRAILFPTPPRTDLKRSNKWEDDCLWCETISLSSACMSYFSCVYVAALWPSKVIISDKKKKRKDLISTQKCFILVEVQLHKYTACDM